MSPLGGEQWRGGSQVADAGSWGDRSGQGEGRTMVTSGGHIPVCCQCGRGGGCGGPASPSSGAAEPGGGGSGAPQALSQEQRCSGKWGSPRADARKGVRAGSDAIRGSGPGYVSRGAPDGRCGRLALPGSCGGALMLSLPAPPAAFTGPPDPLHGSSLYQKVRAAAQVSPGPRSPPGPQLLWGQSSRGRGGGQTDLGQR